MSRTGYPTETATAEAEAAEEEKEGWVREATQMVQAACSVFELLSA